MASARGPGRPSVADERRRQIVDAFLELVAEEGLHDVRLHEVADRAGVARTAVRHFVGNRADLVELALVELARRYQVAARRALGPEPTVRELVDFLFGERWVHGDAHLDRVFDALRLDAAASPAGRVAVRGVYAQLHDEIVATLAREHPTAGRADVAAAAYAITCLSEQNVVLQGVGFDATLSERCGELAIGIAAQLGAPG